LVKAISQVLTAVSNDHNAIPLWQTSSSPKPSMEQSMLILELLSPGTTRSCRVTGMPIHAL